MTIDTAALAEHDLVDRIALVFESSGLPPIAGRVIGRLLLCDPPEQSSAALADYLNASRGSISTSTRQLIQVGIVERVRVRGSRASFFRLRTGIWADLLQLEVLRTARLRVLAEEGLKLLAAADDDRKQRLRDFHDFAAFFESELPALIEHWKQRQEERRQ